MPDHQPRRARRSARRQPWPAPTANPGRLILLVGPDGRGKDVLVAAARRRFAADASFAFPPRVITRAQGPNDTHISVTRSTFQAMRRDAAFLAVWTAGDVGFGIPSEVRNELAAGRTVVVAATPEAITPCRDACSDVRVIEVLAGPDRARGDLARLALMQMRTDVAGNRVQHPLRIEHPGDIAAAVRRFHELLLSDRAERLA